MEPNRVEFQKQCIFQSFCKRVLHNEACNAHEEIRRRRADTFSRAYSISAALIIRAAVSFYPSKFQRRPSTM